MLDKHSSRKQPSGLGFCDRIGRFWFKHQWALDGVAETNLIDCEAANIIDYIQK